MAEKEGQGGAVGLAQLIRDSNRIAELKSWGELFLDPVEGIVKFYITMAVGVVVLSTALFQSMINQLNLGSMLLWAIIVIVLSACVGTMTLLRCVHDRNHMMLEADDERRWEFASSSRRTLVGALNVQALMLYVGLFMILMRAPSS